MFQALFSSCLPATDVALGFLRGLPGPGCLEPRATAAAGHRGAGSQEPEGERVPGGGSSAGGGGPRVGAGGGSRGSAPLAAGTGRQEGARERGPTPWPAEPIAGSAERG